MPAHPRPGGGCTGRRDRSQYRSRSIADRRAIDWHPLIANRPRERRLETEPTTAEHCEPKRTSRCALGYRKRRAYDHVGSTLWS
ncbi:hypothetical protein D8S78_06915 [Natrialba swarupiae]|nr:hypothetical protein [Natrialba swarupiae]